MLSLLTDRSLFRRFLARNIDYLLWTFLLNIVNTTILKLDQVGPLLIYIGVGIMMYSVAEALSLHYFKTTLGKRIFSIEVMNPQMSFGTCLKRSLYANALGMAFGLIFLAPFLWMICLYYYKTRQKMPWDKNWTVEVKDISMIKVFMVLVGIMIFGQALSLVPLFLGSKKEESPKSLIESPHEEKILDRVDVTFFQPKTTSSAYSEACVGGALEYARFKKQTLSFEETNSYCTVGVIKGIKLNYADPVKSKRDSCGFGVSYAIRKLREKASIDPSEELTEEDNEFYLRYCEGTYE